MKKLSIIALFCLPFLAMANAKTKVKFFNGKLNADLKEVKATAKAEGKIFILDFTASWCTPCKWMEETTYNDPNLAEFMSKNCIAVKVDIDDIEGFDLKERYKVEVLPTIIVFDASGKQLARFNESLGPTKLMEGLKKYTTNLKRPALVPNAEPEIAKIPAPKATATAPAKVTAPKEKVTYAPGTGLYKVDISRKINIGFSIQVCSFNQYDNVVKKFDELKTKFGKAVLLNIEMATGGKPVYKILVGEFKTKEEAEKFKKAKTVDGFVKDLATLK